ncbi:hypothetical protein [Dyadobacter fanqingshengii]|nr:hypothetical protein [Dyadobacter fanqingshengii]
MNRTDILGGSGYPMPDLEEEPQLNSPGEDGIDPEMFADIISL